MCSMRVWNGIPWLTREWRGDPDGHRIRPMASSGRVLQSPHSHSGQDMLHEGLHVGRQVGGQQ